MILFFLPIYISFIWHKKEYLRVIKAFARIRIIGFDSYGCLIFGVEVMPGAGVEMVFIE
jgi:hypothetical protein